MGKAEILEELEKLTPEERGEIRLRLAELDHEEWLDDGELTDEDREVIEQRVADLDREAVTSVPWAVAERRLTSRLGR